MTNATAQQISALVPAAREDDAILVERASRLARRTRADVITQRASHLLVFLVGDQRYGVHTSRLSEVWPAHRIQPVWTAPPSVAGIINIRGEVVTVLNGAHVLGLPRTTELRKGYILRMRRTDASLGLHVDSVMHAQPLPDSVALLDAGSACVARRDCLVGLTADGVALLDIDVLFDGDSERSCDPPHHHAGDEGVDS